MTELFTQRRIEKSNACLTEWFTEWLPELVNELLTQSLTDRLTEWLTERLTEAIHSVVIWVVDWVVTECKFCSMRVGLLCSREAPACMEALAELQSFSLYLPLHFYRVMSLLWVGLIISAISLAALPCLLPSLNSFQLDVRVSKRSFLWSRFQWLTSMSAAEWKCQDGNHWYFDAGSVCLSIAKLCQRLIQKLIERLIEWLSEW